MKKMLALMVCLSLVGIAGSAAAYAPVFTFEDLDPINGSESGGPIPASYHGFTWDSNCYWMTKGMAPSTGYDYGTFGHVSMYDAEAKVISFSSGTAFDFNNAYITSAWDPNENVIVEGWLSDNLKYSSTITTHNDKAYWFSFNFTGVDKVKFIPQGSQIVIDNINAVPLPPTVLLLGSGLLGLVGWRRFRKG